MNTQQSYADFEIKVKEPSVPVLIEPHEYTSEDKHELLLKELELFSEYFSFRVHDPELDSKLTSLSLSGTSCAAMDGPWRKWRLHGSGLEAAR